MDDTPLLYVPISAKKFVKVTIEANNQAFCESYTLFSVREEMWLRK